MMGDNGQREKLRRFFAANAMDCDLDASGNLRIPAFLMEHAGLKEKVLVIPSVEAPRGLPTSGNYDRLSIWSKDVVWHDTAFPALGDSQTSDEVTGRCRLVSEDLLQLFNARPELIRGLIPRQFEELMADLYARQGFDVELTPDTKDGGVDLYVVQHTAFGRLLTIVDCKRYSADRPVGVALVRGLLGTVDATKASAGVIATTSYFTSGAIALSNQYPFRLGLQDFQSVRIMVEGVVDPLQ